jgi:uncharacterized protein (TIGR02452 family)
MMKVNHKHQEDADQYDVGMKMADRREKNAMVARETLDIIKSGCYVNSRGKIVELRRILDDAISGSVQYAPAMFPDVFTERDTILASITPLETTFDVVNATTIAASGRLVHETGIDNAACLNFASAKHPGGGFLRGANAQEESIAKASGLYPCIAQMKTMYEENKHFKSALYLDHVIYSPSVPVFRDDHDALLDEPWCISIITAPAVNAGAVRANEPGSESQIREVMTSRSEKLLSIAVVQHCDALILGAWGCGVFQNDPLDVADDFKHHLLDGGMFQGAFTKVVFAILDRTPREDTLAAFSDIFMRS